MKLYLNATSPYARMVRIIMLEKKLESKIELCWCDPWSDDEALLRENPLGRIPTLVTDVGMAISESLLIALYLDEQCSVQPLISADCKENIFHVAGLGVGLMGAAFSTVISAKYLNNEANDSVLSQRRLRAIQRTLEHLEKNLECYLSLESISIGDIAVAVALDYLAFRLPELGISNTYTKLEDWRSNISKRLSFKETAFE
jgi:glutathione S-transferase